MKKMLLILLALCICCLTGCQKETAAPDPVATVTDAQDATTTLADYMATVTAQSDALKTSLEKDDLTQTDMNQKSQELRELWEGALNHLLDEAKKTMTEAELAQLTAEQAAWETEKAAAVEAAGKDVEGGSMYALVVNSEAAKLTEECAAKLYETLK